MGKPVHMEKRARTIVLTEDRGRPGPASYTLDRHARGQRPVRCTGLRSLNGAHQTGKEKNDSRTVTALLRMHYLCVSINGI